MASPTARAMRGNPTDAERKLWARLRRQQLDGFRFRRLQPIGPRIVDFFCPQARLIVEVDSGQHAALEVEDAARTEWLASRGYRVVRYWNNDVLANIEGALVNLRSRLREH